MKLLTFSAFALLLLATLIACGGQTNSTEDTNAAAAPGKFTSEEMAAQQQLWDKVMKLHDEVMPKTTAINQLSKNLKTQWETNKNLDAATKDDISIAIQELESADEGMFAWMHDLKKLEPLRESESHQGILNYLQEQEQSMILIREEMDNSLAKADSLLKKIMVNVEQ